MIEVEKPILKSMNRGYPIYFQQTNQVFLPVFKCGYTSSHKAYSKLGKVLASFNDLLDYKGVEKVTMVRNPFDRVVSLYTSENNRDKLHERSPTFEHFVHNIEELLENGFIDGHYNTLTANLTIGDRFQPDTVFKLENLQELIAHLPQPEGGFPQENRSKQRQADYQGYYTSSELVDLVAKIYEEDLKRFGYTFE
jgi:hypothetical protein